MTRPVADHNVADHNVAEHPVGTGTNLCAATGTVVGTSNSTTVDTSNSTTDTRAGTDVDTRPATNIAVNGDTGSHSEVGELWMAMLASSPHAVVVHSEGTIRWVNDAIVRLGGGCRSDYVGRPLLDFVAPESRPLVVARATAVLTGSQLWAGEMTLIGATGRRRRVQTRGARVEWEGRPAVQVVMTPAADWSGDRLPPVATAT